MARLRGVIFDLDGTLADTRADLASSVNAMLRRLGLPERDESTVVGFIGEGAERLIRRSLGPQHEERYAEAAPIWRDEYAERLLDQTRLYEGIGQLLQGPPDLRAVLTNKPGRFAREILRGLGIESAFRMVLGGDEGPRKPAPEGILLLCERLGIELSEAMLVGDSSVDIATARTAGIRVCAVGWGLGDPAALASADEHCATPAELAALLARLATQGGGDGSDSKREPGRST
ncbi:MAG: HAD family hydrolase [Myxococcales bacterium]|nr:HAD-IA family hydrolase [Myxococcales bacterium]